MLDIAVGLAARCCLVWDLFSCLHSWLPIFTTDKPMYSEFAVIGTDVYNWATSWDYGTFGPS